MITLKILKDIFAISMIQDFFSEILVWLLKRKIRKSWGFYGLLCDFKPDYISAEARIYWYFHKKEFSAEMRDWVKKIHSGEPLPLEYSFNPIRRM